MDTNLLKSLLIETVLLSTGEIFASQGNSLPLQDPQGFLSALQSSTAYLYCDQDFRTISQSKDEMICSKLSSFLNKNHISQIDRAAGRVFLLHAIQNENLPLVVLLQRYGVRLDEVSPGVLLGLKPNYKTGFLHGILNEILVDAASNHHFARFLSFVKTYMVDLNLEQWERARQSLIPELIQVIDSLESRGRFEVTAEMIKNLGIDLSSPHFESVYTDVRAQFFQSVVDENFERAQLFMDFFGMSPDVKDDGGFSIFQWTIGAQNLPGFQFCLKAGADKNGLIRGTALKKALKDRKPEVVQFLVGAGVDKDGMIRNAMLSQALKDQNLKNACFFVEMEADQHGAIRREALNQALRNQNLEDAQFLVAVKADQRGLIRGVALRKALKARKLGDAQFLLKVGADGHRLIRNAALRQAVKEKDVQDVQFLVEVGADVTGDDGIAAFQLAFIARDFDLMTSLISHGVCTDTLAFIDLIIQTINTRDRKMFSFLAKQDHVDWSKPGTDGKIPLHVAIDGQDLTMVMLLFEAGASAKTLSQGQPLLYWAIKIAMSLATPEMIESMKNDLADNGHVGSQFVLPKESFLEKASQKFSNFLRKKENKTQHSEKFSDSDSSSQWQLGDTCAFAIVRALVEGGARLEDRGKNDKGEDGNDVGSAIVAICKGDSADIVGINSWNVLFSYVVNFIQQVQLEQRKSKSSS